VTGATFAQWQPRYAEHGIATFPVTITDDGRKKKPAVSNYLNAGLPASNQFALKFPNAEAFGFACGPRNRLTIVDVDSTEEAILTEAERLFGESPVIWRTGRGRFAMPFRFNGEKRRIRPLPDLPIDLLGGGFVVAPPSAGARRPYEIIKGSLDDLDRLPNARIPHEIANTNTPLPLDRASPTERIPEGRRNDALFNYCRSVVGYCDNPEALIDAAKTWADNRLERGAHPVSDAEMMKTCRSVWMYRGGRRNMVVAGPFVEKEQLHALERDPEALALFAYLSMRQGKGAHFIIANGLADALGWGRRSIPAARKLFLDLKIIACVREARPGEPALYRLAIPHE
jgi:hypothetical protein